MTLPSKTVEGVLAEAVRLLKLCDRDRHLIGHGYQWWGDRDAVLEAADALAAAPVEPRIRPVALCPDHGGVFAGHRKGQRCSHAGCDIVSAYIRPGHTPTAPVEPTVADSRKWEAAALCRYCGKDELCMYGLCLACLREQHGRTFSDVEIDRLEERIMRLAPTPTGSETGGECDACYGTLKVNGEPCGFCVGPLHQETGMEYATLPVREPTGVGERGEKVHQCWRTGLTFDVEPGEKCDECGDRQPAAWDPPYVPMSANAAALPSPTPVVGPVPPRKP